MLMKSTVIYVNNRNEKVTVEWAVEKLSWNEGDLLQIPPELMNGPVRCILHWEIKSYAT
jgi:hypothetical protein